MLKKITKTDVLLLILLILLVWNLFHIDGIRTDVKEYDKKISNIEKEIVVYNKKNDSLYSRLDVINEDINKIDTKIIKVNNNISKINKETNEKIILVDNYTFSDLEKFFAERYK